MSKTAEHDGRINRRRFLAATGAATLVGLTDMGAAAQTTSTGAPLMTGNGEWTYRIVSNWGSLPAGTEFGGTHGGIATDNAGHVYISTQSETGILVYSPEGVLLRTMAHQYPEVHSIVHTVENGVEYLYTTVQKGTPQENWLFVKMKIDGSVVQRITAPPQAGFNAPNAWRLTAAVPAPDGTIIVANGYGDSRLFRFEKDGSYRASYSGKGTEDGLMNCSHGMAVDTRYDQPLLMVCDRENRRLCHFDFDGKFVRTITMHLRRPCQISFFGEHAIISELEGRVTVLDKDNVPVAFLGDNPQKSQWANYALPPSAIATSYFSAAHGCHADQLGNIYISDWNKTGRITKLVKTSV